jgi:hypothetical protein
MRLRHDDGFKSLVAPDRLIGPRLVQSPPLGAPTALAVLKQRRRVPRNLDRVEWSRLKMHANKRQQPASPPVARPENFVVPLGVFPPLSLGRIGPSQRRDEPRL